MDHSKRSTAQNWINFYEREIRGIKQSKHERFHLYWGRYVDLLSCLPRHRYDDAITVEFVYREMTPETRELVKIIFRGELLKKTPKDALNFLYIL